MLQYVQGDILERMYNIRDTALLFGVKVRTVRQWIKDNRINGIKIAGSNRWSVSESEIDRVKNQNKSTTRWRSFYSFFLSINQGNRLHRAVFVVYGELSGGGTKMTADEVKKMIIDKMGEYLKSDGYGEITSEDLKNLAEAYSLLRQDRSCVVTENGISVCY